MARTNEPTYCTFTYHVTAALTGVAPDAQLSALPITDPYDALCYVRALVRDLKFNIRYRDLAEMMQERSFDVHHTTIYRWIQTYAPQLEKLIRWYQGHTGLLVASR